MPRALPLVLAERDLPRPELIAAQLDGEVFAFASGFCPIDEIVQPAHRASVATMGLPHRLIPEQFTAAWIWGALELRPDPQQFCVRLDARVGHASTPAIHVREVVLDDADIAVLGEVAVTTPLRTAVDLARFSSRWTPRERETLDRLMAIGRFDRGDIERYLDARNKLPAKRLALLRIRGLAGSD